LPPPLDLPADFPRPARQDYAGGSLELRLDRELLAGLREVGARQSATLFMTLLAALAVLLRRWSGEEDLVIGAPIADRQYPELENLAGLCLNNLVLRIDLGGAPSFSELLGRVRTRVLEAFENPDTPFEQLVEVLQPARDTSRHPLFDVMFNFVSAPPPEPDRPGLCFEPVGCPDGYSKLMLTLYAYVEGDAVRLRLAYQQALFGAERMGELLSQYGRLLAAVVADPDADVGAYRLTGPQTHPGLPDPTAELSVPDYEDVAAMLERAAVRSPDSLAVRHGQRAWTYAQLHESMLNLRAVLHDLAPGDVVAVTGARSFGVVAAVAGVLSSPGVLLTIDPELPAPRRALMLREAAARVLLIVGAPPQDCETPEGCRVIQVDPQTGLTPIVVQREPTPTAHRGDDPAYVFFTSGSTGAPKGVVGRRKGLAHFLVWQRDTFRVGSADRCAQLTGLSFDVVLRDLLLPLVSGAAVCLPLEEERRNYPLLLQWLQREGITLLHTVPSLARAWLASQGAPVPLPALRCVFFAGEPLTSELVAEWRARLPGVAGSEIINLYGPTETTLAKCWLRVAAEPGPGVQPIGAALPETQVLVLRGDRLCAPYETGELVIRTPFRSLGYLRPTLEDAARFVPNPFRDNSEDLVYRSGDLGYYFPDGAVAILGRRDDQVKIRGVRIEPGEVDAVLRSQPGVREAAVVAHPRDGEPVLTAYLVPSAGPPPTTAELRAALHATLPAYLVPSTFVWLPALPLNPNGKLDRRALPPPQGAPDAAASATAPADELELRLLGIWRRTLGRPGLTVADDFFGAGGHSLLAVQLLTRVELELGQVLPLAVLFQAPTVAAFAELMRTGGWQSNWQALVPIQPQGSLPPLFLVHGIGGGILCFRDLAHRLGREQPVYGLQAVTLGGAEREHERIEAMAAHYVRELRTVQPVGPYFLGGLSFGGTVALEMAQQLLAMGENVALLALLDTKAPGYPRFPGVAQRVAAHLLTILKASPAGRREYARVRLQAAKDQVRRRFLLAVSRRTVGSVDRTLGDIGILHIRAAHAYVRQPYPGMITLLRAEVQPIGCIPDSTNGWSELAQGGVEVLPVPGEHATIIEEPHVAELARALTAALSRARGDS
ncbi:MAG: non-ribosomal peptide synthetase, partial [Actinomycetota bacterium]